MRKLSLLLFSPVVMFFTLRGIDSIDKIVFIQQPALDMEQAVKFAKENRPSFKALQFATQAARFDEKVAISGYLPQLSLTEKQLFYTGGRGFRNETFLQGNQLIYSFSGPLQERRVARKATSVSKYQEEGHWDFVRYSVETAFLQAWLLQEKQRLIKSLDIAANQDVNRAENKDKLGLSGQNDWLKEAALYAQNMAEVNLYSDQLAGAYNVLFYEMGKTPKTGEKLPELSWEWEKEIEIKDIQYYYDLAMRNRKEVKEKQKLVEQQEESKKLFIKSYLPEVSVYGDVSRSSATFQSLGGHYHSAGLNLSWNLFDGAAKFHEYNKANAKKMKALMEKESAILQVRTELEDAYYGLSELLKKLVAKRVEFVQARNEYNLKKLRFEIGDLSKVDFDIATKDFQTRLFSWMSLKIDAQIKQRTLYFACGYPTDL